MLDQIIDFIPHINFILKGAIVTLQFSTIGIIFGAIIGAILAICKVAENKFIKFFAIAYTSIFRGTPMIVQISIIYFAAPSFGINLGVFAAGCIALALNSGAYVSEIVRAGINAVDKGQIEAAKVLGTSGIMRMRDIIMPQAIKKIMPALMNEFINLIKESALVSIIGAADLMRRAQLVAGETYNFFMPMITVAIIYYILIIIITIIGNYIETRLNKY